MQLHRTTVPCRAHSHRAAVRPAQAVGSRPVCVHRPRTLPTIVRAAETDSASTPSATPEPAPEPAPGPEETVFYEGDGGSNVELAISLALTATLIFAPLTMASIGRRLWLRYKFTNKRVIITNISPLFKNEVQLAYSEIKEIRTAPRGFGSWGDMVIFTKKGARLELIGMGQYQELKQYIERCMYTL